MRPLYKLLLGLTGLTLIGGHTAHAQQGIGTGTTPPRTTLDVNGPTAAYETTATLSGANPTYQVPAVGQVQLSGTPTGTIGLTTAAAVPGQRLVVYNNTGVPATLNSQLIPAAQAVEFLYSASGWRASAGGGNGVAANNGLSKTGNTVQLGGPLTQATTVTNNGMPLTIDGSGGSTTFTSGGNVGIGTAAGEAAEKLEVNGNIRLGSEPAVATVGPGNYLEFGGNGVNTDVIGLARFNTAVGSAASNNSELRLVLGDDVVAANSSSADRFVLGTTTAASGPGQVNSGTFTPRFFVYSNGSVGIGGDASPAHILNVTGAVQISGRTTCNDGVSIRTNGQPTMEITSTRLNLGNVGANSLGNFYYNSNVGVGNENHVFGGNVVPDADGAKDLGTINSRWGTVYAANGIIQTSDRRLKTNIENLTYGLKDVLKMRPVAYNWKAQPTTNHMVGFIAQEMEQIVPEAVAAPKAAGEHYGMKYTELIPVLTKAIQEQQAQIEALKTANAKLTSANATLQTSLDGKASASTVDALQAALQTLRGEMQTLQAAGTTARSK
ncbi:tail fiber domain-containing protein [Hymenobacter antarcticus]